MKEEAQKHALTVDEWGIGLAIVPAGAGLATGTITERTGIQRTELLPPNPGHRHNHRLPRSLPQRANRRNLMNSRRASQSLRRRRRRRAKRKRRIRGKSITIIKIKRIRPKRVTKARKGKTPALIRKVPAKKKVGAAVNLTKAARASKVGVKA